MSVYSKRDDIDFSSVQPLDASQEARFREALRKRGDRCFKVFLITAVLTVTLVIAPVFFVVLAWLTRARYRQLADQGRFVPASMITPGGERMNTTSILDMHRTYQDTTLSSATGNTGAIGWNLAQSMHTALAHFVPCLPVHFQFDAEGKTFQLAKPAFADEMPFANSQSGAYVLHLPDKPNICWLVSTPSA